MARFSLPRLSPLFERLHGVLFRPQAGAHDSLLVRRVDVNLVSSSSTSCWHQRRAAEP